MALLQNPSIAMQIITLQSTKFGQLIEIIDSINVHMDVFGKMLHQIQNELVLIKMEDVLIVKHSNINIHQYSVDIYIGTMVKHQKLS